MAVRGRATIVPMIVLGTHQAMRKGSVIIRPATISVRVGVPIESTRLDERDALAAATRMAMKDLLTAGPIQSH